MTKETVSNIISVIIVTVLYGVLIFVNYTYEKKREEIYKNIHKEIITNNKQ